VPDLRSRIFAPARDPFWGAVLALVASLALSFAAIALSGRDAAAGFADLAAGAFGGRGPLGETAIKASVLLLTGLSVAAAFTVGLFNIGAEGQLIWGALAAAVAGRSAVPLVLLWSLLAAALAGAAWGLLAGWLKARRGVHEVISTILLNWIAIHLVHGWLVAGPLAAAGSGAEVSIAGTAPVNPAAWLPRPLPGSRLDAGLPLALAIAAGVWFLLTRTVRGFEWRAVGAGREAAQASGIPAGRRVCEGMALSGALAGLAGALLILGTEHRYPGVFRTGYGFDGIAVALVGGGTVPGTALSALVFGALRAGATRLQLVGIHPSFAELMQGLAVLLVAAPRIFQPLLRRLRGRALPPAGAPPVPTVQT
jgi:simple sugar transport system permease protein